jgi:3-oxoacyl-[acyl-carrier-protein] synthase II
MDGLKRVVITGIGVYSALGFTPGELFDNLAANKSAVVRGGEEESFLPTAPAPRKPELFRTLPRTLRRAMAPSACFTAMAGLAAMRDSGLTQNELAARKAGCAVGSTMGSVSALRDGYALVLSGQSDRLSPMHFFKSASHTTAFNLARTLGLNGAIYSPCSACASGLQSMGLCTALIAAGQETVMFCGGADETGPEVSGSFSLMYAHAPVEDDPACSSRPFSAHRKGLVCGEGAAVFCMEEYGHAVRRGAKIYGEIVGYSSNSGGNGLSQSDAPAIARCMADTCASAGIAPADIDYISAHATSTLQGDAAEAAAIREVFGANVPVSSLKGHLGHTLGASGPLEIAAVFEMARHGVLIPTHNLVDVDPACAGIDHVTAPREKQIRYFFKNSFAFGGINASLICKLNV